MTPATATPRRPSRPGWWGRPTRWCGAAGGDSIPIRRGYRRGVEAGVARCDMPEVGPLLAAGRDSEIFEYGAGRVLRRARDGRSLAHEADVMRHVEAAGYPVPHVHD